MWKDCFYGKCFQTDILNLHMKFLNKLINEKNQLTTACGEKPGNFYPHPYLRHQLQRFKLQLTSLCVLTFLVQLLRNGQKIITLQASLSSKCPIIYQNRLHSALSVPRSINIRTTRESSMQHSRGAPGEIHTDYGLEKDSGSPKQLPYFIS